jgi:D-glycero-D-manno-heptose 1,7-bisphosphate phosphatase
LRAAVFLDRDGVLNRDAAPTVLSASELQMLPRAAEAVARLHHEGWPVLIVTNKTAMGWGLLTRREHEAIMSIVLEAIERAGGKVEAVYHCPHHPWRGCECHKPRPGMLRRAAREHGLDLPRSWMVGDTWRDVGAGKAAGARTILVGGSTKGRRAGPDFVAASLWDAGEVIRHEGKP